MQNEMPERRVSHFQGALASSNSPLNLNWSLRMPNTRRHLWSEPEISGRPTRSRNGRTGRCTETALERRVYRYTVIKVHLAPRQTGHVSGDSRLRC